jgi:hypothetical protein
MTRIEIAADYTSAWDDHGEVVWMTPTTQVAQGLMGQTHPPAGLLAPAVRWIGPNGKVWIWERTPRMIESHYLDGDKKVYFMAMLPWTIEVLDTIEGTLRVFARNSPLASMGDGLCHLGLPGVSQDGRVPIPKLKGGDAVDNMIFRAKHAFDTAIWTGETPKERLPTALQHHIPTVVLEKWSQLSLLQATALDWPLYMPFSEFVQTLDVTPKVSLKEMFEKAAGQR